MIELRELILPLGYTDALLRTTVAERLGVSADTVGEIQLLRRAVDARRERVRFAASVAAEVQNEESLIQTGRAQRHVPYIAPRPEVLKGKPRTRPVVCGAGPAGLFAALELARAGAEPLLIERGAPVERRLADIENFSRTRILNPSSNIQFGEGGAGAFSDGKLTTGIGGKAARTVLHTLYECGAPEEILWQGKPHIGTDRLPDVVRGLRQAILDAGGEVWFDTRLCGLKVTDGALRGVVLERNGRTEELETEKLVLAAGHSARDVYEMLYELGVPLEQKAFSLGVRAEHSQAAIDRAQYGSAAGHPALGAADYKLSCHLPSGRAVYSFCMCPGGEVVAAASEPFCVVTNGMSRFARDGVNANAAILVSVMPSDFGSAHPLAGIEFQRRWEHAAFQLGGGDYTAPAQYLGDFLARRAPTKAPKRAVRGSYPLGLRFVELDDCLPGFVTASLREAFPIFGRRLRGFDHPGALLTGVETRSSSPVRVLRNAAMESVGLRGLYPCGEGAGQAGGIVSAAADGLRVAEALLQSLR
ncbi:MAG: hypothetical protein Q4A39_05855 [Eubacteriales bacterium]|nr:hypothetical protein [Eubacteriales bacterium]